MARIVSIGLLMWFLGGIEAVAHAQQFHIAVNTLTPASLGASLDRVKAAIQSSDNSYLVLGRTARLSPPRATLINVSPSGGGGELGTFLRRPRT